MAQPLLLALLLALLHYTFSMLFRSFVRSLNTWISATFLWTATHRHTGADKQRQTEISPRHAEAPPAGTSEKKQERNDLSECHIGLGKDKLLLPLLVASLGFFCSHSFLLSFLPFFFFYFFSFSSLLSCTIRLFGADFFAVCANAAREVACWLSLSLSLFADVAEWSSVWYGLMNLLLNVFLLSFWCPFWRFLLCSSSSLPHGMERTRWAHQLGLPLSFSFWVLLSCSVAVKSPSMAISLSPSPALLDLPAWRCIECI